MPWNDGHVSWMSVSWIAGVVLLFVLVRWAVMPAGRGSQEGESPERILKKRYAQGEIGREEYLRRLDELRR